MNVQLMVAGVLLVAAITGMVRWQQKLARTKRYGARRHRHRKPIKRDNWATKLLRENPARRLMERRHYRSPGKTDQTL